MALPAKNLLDEAESAGFGVSKHKDDNEVSAVFCPSDEDLSPGPQVFRRNPGLPSPPSEVVLTDLGPFTWRLKAQLSRVHDVQRIGNPFDFA